MTCDDDIDSREYDQPPFRTDFCAWEPAEPEWTGWWPDGELSAIPPKPRTIGILAGGGFDELSLDEILAIIPEELQEGRTWCVWGFQFDDATQKWKKRPYVPFRGSRVGNRPASSTNSENWVRIEAAFAALTRDSVDQVDGIGRFFSVKDPFVGIDLDHCADESGYSQPWAVAILAMFPGSYVEYSPSGTGLKIWTKGKLPGKGRKVEGLSDDSKGAIEIYDRHRYFAVTARPYGEPVEEIADGSAAVLALYERLGGLHKGAGNSAVEGGPPAKSVGAAVAPIAAVGSSALSDDQVIARARRAYLDFSALFELGDLSCHANNWSRADAALVKQIAYFSAGDRDQIERVFGRSALAKREKWTTRPDYRDATISAVLARMTRFYDPTYRSLSRRCAAGRSSQWGGV